ncbi:MAG: FAD-binding oxidoreductase [Sneathiella sp.]|nr:FAD-binding oxidoreductase [Sneathiella sp.]
MAEASQKTVLVIGAGIVGVSTAYRLQKAGYQVSLVDRIGPCAGTSYGNAGGIVDSCVPNALPGLIKNVPKMLLDPTGPLTVRWSYLRQITPWLVKFIDEARPEKVKHNSKALHQLTSRAVGAWNSLLDETKLRHLMVDKGWLKVYDSEDEFNATHNMREILLKNGAEFDVLGIGDIRDLEPNLSHIFKHGIYHKNSRFLLNPEKTVHGIADAFKQAGGQIVISDIHTIKEEQGVVSAIGSVGTLKADKLILSAGAWSRHLAAQMGADLPLDTERGYHLMMPVIEEKGIDRPVVYGEKSFVLSPMERGIRMTSQVEFAGLDRGPDFRRVRKLLPYAQKMLPSLKAEEQDVWLGYRPSMPDSLPVIGTSPKSENVVFAFGHQHLGMTLGPITAQVIEEILAGNKTSFPIWPYRANRF